MPLNNPDRSQNIRSTPVGQVASTNLQAALAEIDAEKLAISSLTSINSDLLLSGFNTTERVLGIIGIDNVNQKGVIRLGESFNQIEASYRSAVVYKAYAGHSFFNNNNQEIARFGSGVNSRSSVFYGNTFLSGKLFVGSTATPNARAQIFGGVAITVASALAADPGNGNLFVESAVTSGQFKLSALNNFPSSSSSSGTTGEIRFTADHIYVCVAPNTWKRAVLNSW